MVLTSTTCLKKSIAEIVVNICCYDQNVLNCKYLCSSNPFDTSLSDLSDDWRSLQRQTHFLPIDCSYFCPVSPVSFIKQVKIV